MAHKITNRTGSPYDLPAADGTMVRLPAFGDVTGDFAPDYIQVLEASMAVSVSEPDHKPRKVPVVDPDPVVAEASLDMWREEYTKLTGEEPDKRWKEARLISEIEKASK